LNGTLAACANANPCPIFGSEGTCSKKINTNKGFKQKVAKTKKPQ